MYDPYWRPKKGKYQRWMEFWSDFWYIKTYADNGIIGPGFSRWESSKDFNYGKLSLFLMIGVIGVVVGYII